MSTLSPTELRDLVIALVTRVTELERTVPAGVGGHFGPELRRFILAQYHQSQVTVGRLLAQLRAIGIDVSKRQIMRLLIAGQEGFIDEARGVLRAGLADAAWISVDDTGARHKATNGVCTQIGNDHFAWFGTTASKSRLIPSKKQSVLESGRPPRPGRFRS